MSTSSNGHSYTAYYYTERDIHPLCIQSWEITTSSALIKTSVSRWGFVVSVSRWDFVVSVMGEGFGELP